MCLCNDAIFNKHLNILFLSARARGQKKLALLFVSMRVPVMEVTLVRVLRAILLRTTIAVQVTGKLNSY